MPIDGLDAATAARVYHLYLPIYFFARHCVRSQQGQQPSSSSPAFATAIGLSAPQGCGKTTLVDLLVDRFASDGLSCASVSFDDFYLTGAEQDAVAATHPSNPMLQVRGNAGTHDLQLGSATLRALKQREEGEEALALPRYDKALRSGRGDRAPRADWPLLTSPADVLLLEGWMAGFKPLPPEAPVLSQHEGLPGVNALLEGYQATWHALMDAWVVLGVDDPRIVHTWRLQAERAMAAAGRPGMTDDQVADFVNRYMPSYHAYLPQLYASAGADGVDGKPTFMVKVDESRNPVG